VPLTERHQPSGLNSDFKSEGFSFEDYEQFSRKMIADARKDRDSADREHIIDGNAPFDLLPASSCPQGTEKKHRRGVLLSHGLTDSPYSMRALGVFFQAHCFRVMAILLPGHGTRPGDLLDVSWQEWAEAEAFGVAALSSEVEKVYLAGFSTGGALSLYQALRDSRVSGLFLFSPAIQITSLAALANWHKAYSWLAPRAQWSDIRADEDTFKYESFPLNAADQIHLLTREVRARLDAKPLTVPVFIAASDEDTTVETAGTVGFFKQAKNRLNRMVLYSAEAPAVPATDRIEVVNSHFPEQHILSSAHTAIVLPPDDPHYGASGAYANCLHYLDDAPEKHALCKSRRHDFLGEITDPNLKKGVVRRLTYNPQFDALMTRLAQFISTLP
jgi:esterase/lipase